MTAYLQIARERCPKAAARGRIAGNGPYALLSCNDGASRWVRLFESVTDRARLLKKWNGADYPGAPQGRCLVGNCVGDHVLLTLENK
jgi:hypothetical protein